MREGEPFEERLKQALEAARIEIWECKLPAGVGEDFYRGIHADDLSRVRAAVLSAIDRQSAYDLEFRVVLGVDEVRWVRDTGRIEGDWFTGLRIDITERKRLELRDAMLLELDDRTRSLTSKEEIVETSTQLLGGYLKAQDCSYLEAPLELPDADLAVLRSGRPLERNTAEGSLLYVPIQRAGVLLAAMAARGDAPRQWRDFEIRAARLAANRCWESLERSRAAQEFRTSEGRLRLAQRAARIGSFEISYPGPVVVWTAEMEYLYGLPEGGFEGTIDAWLDRIEPEDRQRVVDDISGRIQQRETDISFEYRNILPDGSNRWIRGQGLITYAEDPESLRIVGVSMDIDDWKRAEARMSLLEAAVESANDAVIITEANLEFPGPRMEYVNPAFTRMTQYAREEAIGQTPRLLQGPKTDRELMAKLRSDLETEQSFHGQTVNYRKDGTEYTVEWRITPVKSADGSVARWVSVQQDVTERVQSEEALRNSEERYRVLSESVPQLIWSAAADGRVEYLSGQWLGYTGRVSLEDAQRAWVDSIHPEDREQALRAWQEAVEKKTDFDATFRIRRYEGTYRWFKTRARPLFDQGERVRLWSGTSTDFDDQVRTERELRRANQDLEQFAFSASHDLQEPIRNVAIYSQLIQRRYQTQLDEDAAVYLGYLTEGAQRMGSLVQDLLAYTQAATANNEPAEATDSQAILDDVCRDLSQAIAQSGAAISAGELPAVRMREIHVRQVFQNLITNAIKYSKPGEAPRLDITAELRGSQVRFSFRDQGIGIAPEYHNQVFGVFKRLHDRTHYPGTGIGLAISQRIVEGYDGRIWVESRPGEGATFFFTAPCAE